MSDLTYKMEYLRVPHPLKKGDIIVGETWQSYKTLGQISRACADRRYNLPRLGRYLILSAGQKANIGEKEVANYDRNFTRNLENKANLDILKGWVRLGIAFSISYLIWSLPWVYAAVDRFFGLLGDFMSPYAAVVLTIAPILAAVYVQFFGRRSFFKLKARLGPLKLYGELGKSELSRFVQDLKDLAKNIRWKTKRDHPVNEGLSSLIQILKKGDWRLEELTESLESILNQASQDPDFPWGERKNLEEMAEDILYHAKKNFAFAPLEVVSSSETNNEDSVSPEQTKAQNLRAFLEDEEATTTRQEIVRRYRSLQRALSSQRVLKSLKEISSRFQRLIFFTSRYNLAETPSSYDRAKTLKDLYHSLFVYFGRTANILARRKLKGAALRLFLKKLDDRIDILLNLKTRPYRYRLLRVGASWVGGPVLSLAILVGAGSLMGFYWLGSDEVSIIHRHRFGYEGLLGDEVTTIDYADNGILEIPTLDKKLFWLPPKPLAFFHKIKTCRTYQTNVFMVLKETEPANILDTFFHFFKETWGRNNTGLNLEFSYKVENPEAWAEYDYDGKGTERLSRDLESYVIAYTNKRKEPYRRKLSEERVWEAYFEEAVEEGQVGDWIRRFVYPSIFDAYRTGSSYERVLAGLTRIKAHPRMMIEPEWREFVEHEIEAIESLIRIEHEELISKPRLVRRIMKERGIPGMYALLQKEEFKDLYGTIAYLLTERYINDQILGESEQVGLEEGAHELTRGLVDWIHENSRLEELIGIRIREMESSIKNMSYLSWQNDIRKRENLF